MNEKPKGLTKVDFEAWPKTGEVVANREVRTNGYWGAGVWWDDDFGVCAPIVASLGGPLGHRARDRAT